MHCMCLYIHTPYIQSTGLTVGLPQRQTGHFGVDLRGRIDRRLFLRQEVRFLSFCQIELSQFRIEYYAGNCHEVLQLTTRPDVGRKRGVIQETVVMWKRVRALITEYME